MKLLREIDMLIPNFTMQTAGLFRSGSKVLLTAFSIMVFISACANEPKAPDPTVIELAISASQDANPDTSGRPSPVSVRLFQLSSATIFKRADFFQLLDEPESVLSETLVGKQDVVINPGKSSVVSMVFEDRGKVLGIIATFRDIDHAQWRAVLPVTSNKLNKVAGVISKLSVQLSKIE